MAIKQRALMKLDVLDSHMHNAMKEKGRTALRDAYNVLAELRDMYKEGLPSSNYPVYGEIYDGLIVAVQQLIVDKDIDSQQDVYLLCDELIQYIKKETEQEKHFKKEIVFLPYQAAMWDSLESVWKAADEDKEHCNAYVVPIPYCERNPDTSAFEWHCEREKFPKYVPTLDWKNVDLEAWHPDVIFFHNPFDNQNHVTSVDSRYYSSNLKNITDKLVYIPYAVEEEIQPGDEAAETAIEHRVLCPGIINAHLVIAQSEDMRQAWINILMRRTNVKDRAYWEKHILGLGSPKIDKVLTSKKEDFEMPEKWLKLIKGKKVILYITSISPTLQYSDKVCDKLRYVFDIFKNRDDVVLWWRPHPLMKATFHSMRPQYEKEYLSIEKQYIEEGWGIYDDSSDLHRAICYSDAYYGDKSSVAHMYMKTGKMGLIQDIAMTSGRMSGVYFDNFTRNENKIWGISRGSFIGLYEMNLDSGSMKCLGELPTRYGRILPWLTEYSVLDRIGEKIIIAPYFSTEDFIQYDLIKKSFCKLFVKYRSYLKNKPWRIYPEFTNCGKWNNHLLFIGNGTGTIVDYDASNGKISHHTMEFPHGEDKLLFATHGTQVEQYLYMTALESNRIVQLDLETFSVKIHVIPYDFKGREVLFDGEFIWVLSNFRDSLVKFDFKQNTFDLMNTQELFSKYYVSNYLFNQKEDLKNSWFVNSDNGDLFVLGIDRVLEKMSYMNQSSEKYYQKLDVVPEYQHKYSSKRIKDLQFYDEMFDMSIHEFLKNELELRRKNREYPYCAGNLIMDCVCR